MANKGGAALGDNQKAFLLFVCPLSEKKQASVVTYVPDVTFPRLPRKKKKNGYLVFIYFFYNDKGLFSPSVLVFFF